MTLFQSLTHRSFALLWSGQTISRLGDSLYRIALAWWVLQKTGSAAAMGTVLIFSSVPLLIFLLIGGVAVDRFSRVRVMIASDVLRGIVVGLVALLALTDRLEIWHVYVAAILFGFVAAFFLPAYTALIPEITPAQALPSANSLTSLSGQFTGVLGPALGALIVAVGGTPIAFVLDGVSFIISAACLLPLSALPALRATLTRAPSALRDLHEGLGVVLASPWLWITIAVFGVINVTEGGPFIVALPFLLKTNLNADVGALGVVYSMFSLGSVLGAVQLGRMKKLRRRGLWAYVATMTTGLMVLGMGLLAWLGLPQSIALAGIFVAALIRGVTYAVFGLIWTNTLQELVPREMLGRVSSIDSLGSFVLFPVGFGVAGWAADLIGAPAVFIIGGATTVVLAALPLLHSAIRNLD